VCGAWTRTPSSRQGVPAVTTRSALIIGSGAAAAGVALALARQDDLAITVIDIGVQLEEDRRDAVDVLASAKQAEWEESLLRLISTEPVDSGSRGVPEKRCYGSDYPFRNVGQLAGLVPARGVATSIVSAAYGGFSTVWGSQFMPFSASAFAAWPFGASALRPHYESVLSEVPYAAEVDDLAENFPLLHESDPLPELSERTQRVLQAYDRHRSVLNARGITIGKARLAFRARDCVRCGLCMTGCPYALIYSAAQTFDTLRQSRRVKYHGGLMAVKISEEAAGATVIAREVASGQAHAFAADRVFVACGAIGTTRLVASSLGLFGIEMPILESQQFVLPALSRHACRDPRSEPDFTLNQFNILVAPQGDATDLAQLHFYTYNRAFLDAMPALLRAGRMEKARARLLSRLSVALGYLPSWRSPRLKVRVDSSADSGYLPDVRVSRDAAPKGRNRMLRLLLYRLALSGPALDLYPIIPLVRLAEGGKSYHWGGGFPHESHPSSRTSTDRVGRVEPWRRVHIVDASVFPTIPAMTFGLTVMANAHRIACEALELAS
jgi:choline dehydrogenase-like flavoprotein